MCLFKVFQHFLALGILYWKQERIFFIAYRMVYYILLWFIWVCMRGIRQLAVMWSYHNIWFRIWCILQFLCLLQYSKYYSNNSDLITSSFFIFFDLKIYVKSNIFLTTLIATLTLSLNWNELNNDTVVCCRAAYSQYLTCFIIAEFYISSVVFLFINSKLLLYCVKCYVNKCDLTF